MTPTGGNSGRRWFALTASALALALAACGGTSSSTHTDSLKPGFEADRGPYHQFGVDLEHAISGARNKTNAQLASEFQKLSSRAYDQATRLGRLHASGNEQAYLDKLVAGFTSLGADLQRIAGAASRNDAPTATAATRSLIADAKQVKAADAKLTAAVGQASGK